MANKAYRSRATGSWSNSGGTVWDVYSTTATAGVFPAGSWSQAAANDYPTAGDYVWIQSSNVVTYDPIAILAIGSGTFAQISRTLAAHVSYSGTIAQPSGTGGIGPSDATTGYIAISTTGMQSLRANYYIIGTGFGANTGMFTISNSTITLNIGASSGVSSFCEGTGTAILLFVLTSLSSVTVNITSSTDLKQGGSSRVIALGSSITLNINAPTIDLTTASASYIDCTGQSPSVNITGNLQGTNSSNGSLAIWCIVSTGAPTITVSGNCLSGTTGGCISVAQGVANYVQVGGNIRNYGLSGITPTGLINAIVGTSIRLTSTGSHIYYNIGGEADFKVTGTSVSTAEQYWSYLTTESAFSTTNAIGKLIKDNLDATISSRLAPTTSGRTLDVSTTGEAGLDFDNIKQASGATTLSNITIPTTTAVTNAVTVGTINNDVITSASLATSAVTEIRDAIWNELENNTLSLSKITRLQNVSTAQITGDQLASYNT